MLVQARLSSKDKKLNGIGQNLDPMRVNIMCLTARKKSVQTATGIGVIFLYEFQCEYDKKLLGGGNIKFLWYR